VTDPLLADLDPEQLAAVTDPRVPLAIVAPAGSGKTRVLTRRIAFRVREGAAEARHVLALTFTRKAAGELGERLRMLGVADEVTAGTFHATALAQLRAAAAERQAAPPVLLEHKGRVVAGLLGPAGRRRATVDAIVAEIEWAQARMIRPEEYVAAAAAAGRATERPPAEIADAYDRYRNEKRSRRVLDFDDLLRTCAERIDRDPVFAEQQRFRFRHLFVDEFQDATPLQLALLRAWLGDRDDLTVVGDPAQSIYAFAGADASPLHEFGLVFPGGATVALVRNHRATSAVVGIAEVALGDAGGRTRITPAAERGRGPAATITAHDDPEAEAAAVAEGCRRAFRSGVPWSGIAVLFRVNAQSRAFEEALAARGIPFRVADGRSAGRPGWPLLLDRLRELEREGPTRPLPDLVADLAAEPLEPDSVAAVDDLAGDRDDLVALARSYLAAETGPPAVAGLAAWLEATARDRAPEAVDLVTFHRAKGLEWNVVFVTGLEQGLVPLSRARSAEALAEERRLLHVALSRAADQLHCSWARHRTFDGRRVERKPSPWLRELEVAARADALPTDERKVRLAAMRDALDAATPPRPRRRTRRVG